MELSCESIPGCVLQIYVLMTTPGSSSSGAIASIGISTLTTGFASAMIAFDKDVDVKGRKRSPNFYGYIPDDHGLRGRCFVLMTLMGALHNFSRSVAYALLATSGGAKLVWSFAGVEVLFYLVWKTVRGDYMYWIPFYGALGVIASFPARIIVKIIVDFSGCLHFR